MKNKIFLYPNGKRIFYTVHNQKADTVLLYLHGLMSSRTSDKGKSILSYAKKNHLGFLSLDYTAHGESDGDKTEFRVGTCLEDILSVFDLELKNKKVIVIGSSLGGWLSLLLAEKRKQKIFGLITLAVAADFTKLVWEYMFNEDIKTRLKSGEVLGPSEETKGHCFTYQMFEEAEKHCLLNRTINYNGPCLLVHGDKDEIIPYMNSFKVKEALSSTKVCVQIIKDETHLLKGYKLQLAIDFILQQVKE